MPTFTLSKNIELGADIAGAKVCALIWPRPRLFDNWCPASDVVAHEGCEIGRTAAGWSGAFVLELFAHTWIVERGDDGGIEFVCDFGRQFRRAENAEPRSRFKSGYDLANCGQIGK